MTVTAAEPKSKAAKPNITLAEPGERLKPIPGKHKVLAQLVRNVYQISARDELTRENFEDPDCWSMVCNGWLYLDRLEIVQSHTYTEALVVDVGPGFAMVRVLSSIELPARTGGAASAVPTGYDIRRGLPSEAPCPPWVVIRLSDNLMMNRNQVSHDTFETARRWLLDHASTRGV